MCFGNDSPPSAPQFGPPPPPPEFMDVIDEITGTQSVIVTGADGKKRRVNSRLPRTPEEEQRFKMAEQLIASSIQNIKQLYQYNPQSVVDFAPIVETFANINRERLQSLSQIANIGNIEQDVADFKKMQSTLIDEQFQNKNRSNEERLAHSGRGSGTYAAESRAALARNEALARQQGDIQGSIYGEELSSKRLARNKEAFNLQEMGRQGQLQSAQGQYDLAKQHEADMERRRLMAIEENKGLLNIGSAITGQDLNKALSNNNVQTSLGTFNAQSADSLNRYNADINRQQANYKMAMDEYNSRPPSMMEGLLRTGAQVGGAFFGGGGSMPFMPSGSNRVGSDTVGRMYRG